MSQAMDLIDEAREQRDAWEREAHQWQYIATLLALMVHAHDLSYEWRIPKTKRNIGGHYLVPEEMEDGGLKVTLMEETN